MPKTMYEECLMVWEILKSTPELYNISKDDEELKILALKQLGLYVKYGSPDRLCYCPGCFLDEIFSGTCETCGLVEQHEGKVRCSSQFFAFVGNPNTETAAAFYDFVKQNWKDEHKDYYYEDGFVKHLTNPDVKIAVPNDDEDETEEY